MARESLGILVPNPSLGDALQMEVCVALI